MNEHGNPQSEQELYRYLLEHGVSLLGRRDYGETELARRLAQALLKRLRPPRSAKSRFASQREPWSEASALQKEQGSLSYAEQVPPELSEQSQQQLIAQVVTRLQVLGYLDDQRAARANVRQAVARGQGPLRIKAALQQKALPLEELQGEEAPADWLAQARAVRERRFGKALPTEAKEKAKQLRFLLYRGFNMQQALSALQQSEWDEWDD